LAITPAVSVEAIAVEVPTKSMLMASPELTLSVAVVLCEIDPLVPPTVSVDAASGVPEVVDTWSVALPAPPAIDAGIKEFGIVVGTTGAEIRAAVGDGS
jgi:hypothetical protein